MDSPDDDPEKFASNKAGLSDESVAAVSPDRGSISADRGRTFKEHMGVASGVRAVQGVLDAIEAVDIDEYLPHVTEDVVIFPPGFVIGPDELRGHEGIRAAIAKLKKTLGSERELTFGKRRYFLDRAVKNTVLVGMEITISNKLTGEWFGTEASMLSTVVGDKVSKMESWTTREDGLAQLHDPVAL